mmetsp:Transcript_34592/g.87891  ORF Transcript_34592/g.87891 Transcript_34592/m.87891 type:complete len:222 (-) Transcript_34592:76-741(-)
MVAAFKLDDLLALRVSPYQADHAHASLCARVRKPHHLHRGHCIDHHLGQLVLQRRRCAKGRAFGHLLLQGLQHLIVRMANDCWAPCPDIVDVLVVVHVPSIGALHAVEDNGVAPNGLERAHGAGDASGHQILRLGENPVGGLRLQALAHRPARRAANSLAPPCAYGHARKHGDCQGPRDAALTGTCALGVRHIRELRAAQSLWDWCRTWSEREGSQGRGHG